MAVKSPNQSFRFSLDTPCVYQSPSLKFTQNFFMRWTCWSFFPTVDSNMGSVYSYERSKTSAALVLTATVFMMKTERNKSTHFSTPQDCHPLTRSPILPDTTQFFSQYFAIFVPRCLIVMLLFWNLLLPAWCWIRWCRSCYCWLRWIMMFHSPHVPPTLHNYGFPVKTYCISWDSLPSFTLHDSETQWYHSQRFLTNPLTWDLSQCSS
jgi:hypothetical protein